MTKFFMSLIGGLSLLIGLALGWLPLVPGIPLVILGIVCLAPVSPRMAALVRHSRRFDFVDRGLVRIGARLPQPYRRILSLTER